MRTPFIVSAAIVLVLVLAATIFFQRSPSTEPAALASDPLTTAAPTLTPEPSPTPTPAYAEPIADFRARITKKNYGAYITPQNSPVQPEKFTGYHTAVDVEYQDIAGDVPVYAIADGTVRRSGRVSGYGGLLIVEHTGPTSSFFTVYGHIRPSSLPAVASTVTRGQRIGLLGTGYSSETDNERRHLHFGVITASTIDVRGYTQKEADLTSIWRNPLELFAE